MKKYFSYFKLRFNIALQYRVSAIAGMLTQFFWAVMQILIYKAFYKNSICQNISLEQLISYVWLRQAFYSLINHITDSEIKLQIENGNIAYDLIKPGDPYWMWFFKTISTRIASVMLKCLPILIITPLLPFGYKLNGPVNVNAFILFLITLFVGILIIASIINLYYISIFYTMTSKGTASIFYGLLEFFGGGLVPIALMPSIWQKICYYLPVSLASDLPFRIYTGNIDIFAGIRYIALQTIWLMGLILIGKILLNKQLKKAVIQGG